MKIISAAEYQEKMTQEVIPFLAARRRSGSFERREGEPLYFERLEAEHPAASVVLVHGYSEGIDKFRESAYYVLHMGMNVWLIQQREHGRSFRSTDDPDLICIRDYRDLVEDLHFFVSRIVKKDPAGKDLPLYLYGHSMGGGVSTCYLEQYPDDFKKAVLSSPMLELNAGGTPVWAAAAYAKLTILMGKGAGYAPGSAPFTGREDFENACTTCRERYDFWLEEQKAHRENQMCVMALSTVYQFLQLTRFASSPKNTARIKADVLLFRAGKDTLVAPGGQ